MKYSRYLGIYDYGSQPQNWWLCQSPQGLIYAANSNGVLEFNGVSWNRIDIPNKKVHSLSVDRKCTVYVGGIIGELGYIGHDEQGKPQYLSLTSYIDNKKNSGTVYRTHTLRDGVFFRTPRRVFLWSPEKKEMTIPLEVKNKNEPNFNASFACGGRLFVKQKGIGIYHWTGNEFKRIPGSRELSKFMIFIIAPMDTQNKAFLVGTREKGFFLYDGNYFTPYPVTKETEFFISKNRASHAVMLSQSPGQIAIGTHRSGLIIIDTQGKILYKLSRDQGLPDNNVHCVFEDRQGNIWLALDKGITKVEYQSPFSIFDDRTGLFGMVTAVVRKKNRIYAGTKQGLFYKDHSAHRFNLFQEMTASCWHLLEVEGAVLAATSDGVFELKPEGTEKIIGDRSFTLLRSRKTPNRVWVGTRKGPVAIIKKLNGQNPEQWTEEYRFTHLAKDITTMAEDRRGNLWLGLRGAGVSRIHFPKNEKFNNFQVTDFDDSNNLPVGEIQVFQLKQMLLFGSKGGLFRFDEQTNRFIADKTLGKSNADELRNIFRLVEDKKKSIWVHAKGKNYRFFPKGDGAYGKEEKPFARIPIDSQVNAIYPDPGGGMIWFPTHNGLICYRKEFKKNYQLPFPTLISKVSINGTPRFFFQSSQADRKPLVYVFDHQKSSFSFEVAAPFFEAERDTIYHYYLEDFDAGWNKGVKETVKTYPELPYGKYTFHAKAENIYGVMGSETKFSFRILPPPYLTWWAILIYVLLFILIVYLIRKWRKREREKRALEEAVFLKNSELEDKNLELEEKNGELHKQKITLEEQAEKLKEQAAELISKQTILEAQAGELKEKDLYKSRFFANISHEFRTPLTLILKPLELLLGKSPPQDWRSVLTTAQNNCQRLLNLINQLLDLSKLDSGKMTLKASPMDIRPLLKGIAASFEHSLGKKQVNLQIDFPHNPLIIYCDSEHMSTIFTNLLSNADKFIPDGGNIILSAKESREAQEGFPGGFAEIKVRDSGEGIPLEKIQHIFDRFYQAASEKHEHKGTGIGLALVKELVLLHQGKIDVISREGEGSFTEFILCLPLGKSHLRPGQLAETPQPLLKAAPGNETGPSTQQIIPPSLPGKKKPGRKKHRKTILVVEDHPDMRQYIIKAIEADYRVLEAENGAQGIERALKNKPDMIISDVMMPELNGFQLCAQLRKNVETSHIPIVLLTAKAAESNIVEGLDKGADDYILKPFSNAVLLSRINNLIERRRLLQVKIQNDLMQPEPVDVTTADQRFLDTLKKTVEDNIGDVSFNVNALSEKMDLSRATIAKKIQALTGQAPTDYIRTYRLLRGKQLLEEGFGNVLEIANEVGFDNPSYFTTCFNLKFGINPSKIKTKSKQ